MFDDHEKKGHKDFSPSFFHAIKLGYLKSEKKHLRRRKELKKKEYEING
jgi:hypothetical protein